MITALADITEEIFIVLPKGARPIFPIGAVDPAATVTSNELISSLTRHYGYTETRGGKGSHVKLTKTGRPPVVIPGGRSTVSPGVVKHVLKAIGGYPLSRARDFVEGSLPDRSIS
ncbi:MAG: type II toxin-antitoxin system HicA family toxin [Gammaproteobacteria bacterium]|nr:type II toxin-antitoxin system HicA family toxin [Gammaproteobacteria bacterium]